MYDFGFYVTHRIMHIPWLYKNIHYLHHSSRSPCVLAQVYFHPIDLIVSLLPVSLPPILLNSHIATKTVWNCVLVLGTC
jgi:sterol desaturase/sphingolipid hydroxylase (fatty acid hydroxylase superfamily)